MEEPIRTRPLSPIRPTTSMCICGHIKPCKGNTQSPTSFLFQNPMYSDMKVRLSDKSEFHCHVLIVGPWSAVISSMFIGEGIRMREGKSRILEVVDHEPEIVRLTFQILYNLPCYKQGMINGTNAFDVFEMAHMYSITTVQNICVAEINKIMFDTGSSMQFSEGVKYVEMIRNVLNRWLKFYYDSVCPPETTEILEDLITTVITSVKSNVALWMSNKLSYNLLSGLSMQGMEFLLTYDGLGVLEINLVELYLIWMYQRCGDMIKNEKGEVTAITPKIARATSDEEVELLNCIRWGSITHQDILKLYNTIVSTKGESKCLPPQVVQRFKEIMLEASLIKTNLGEVTLQYQCSSSSTKRKAVRSHRRKNNHRRKLDE